MFVEFGEDNFYDEGVIRNYGTTEFDVVDFGEEELFLGIVSVCVVC